MSKNDIKISFRLNNGFVLLLLILFTFTSLFTLCFITPDMEHVTTYTTDVSGIIHGTNMQQIFNAFVSELSKLNYRSSSISTQINELTVHGINFQSISIQLIADVLSNKTIVLFGDSLHYYLTSYLLHVIHWCLYDNFHDCICPTFCDHLDSKNNLSLILGVCEKRMIWNRTILVKMVDEFDDHEGYFAKDSKSYAYFAQYNISVHLYYKWGEDITNVQEMMDAIEYYKDADIMINNLVNHHWTLTSRNMNSWNYHLSVSMIKHLEFYIDQIVKIRNNKLLILGPVNPWFHFGTSQKLWLNFETHFALQNCEYIPEEYQLKNVSNILNASRFDDAQTKIISNIISSPSIVSCIASLEYPEDNGFDQTTKYKWKNHLNYSWPQIIVNRTMSCTRTKWCFFLEMCHNSIRRRDLKNVQSKEAYNVRINLCLLYHQGLGQTLIAERFKNYIDYVNNDIALPQKSNVYYHDQYKLYHSLKQLSRHVAGDIHYPQLAPIAWTNLLNIILNGE
eukprot:429865_1